MSSKFSLEIENETLEKFLKTGILDQLSINLSPTQIINLLGQPLYIWNDKGEYFDFVGNEGLFVLNYEGLEITFENQKMIFFKLLIDQRVTLPLKSLLKWYEELKEWDFNKFHKFLKEHNIKCQKVVSPYILEKNNIMLWLPDVNIEIDFFEKNNFMLDSILFSILPPGNRPMEDC